MADKFLTQAGWKAAVAKSKTKDLKDDAFVKALGLYEGFKEDDTSERRDALDDVTSAATALKKDKAVAAVPALVTYLGEVIKAAAAARMKIAADLGKVGMKAIDLQIIAVNWDGEPMGGYEAFVEFKAPGTPTVTLKQEIKGGVVSFNDVSLAPSGTMRFMAVSKGKASLLPVGVVDYDLPAKPIAKFKAVQDSIDVKKRAKSGKEASEKSGLEGEAGVDWKIVKIGGKATSEEESKKTYEEEAEFVMKAGKASFAITKL